MPTKDNTPGLLSKVAKFVRNPTTNWTDLDKQDPEPDAGYSKQALKEMIERKRQNDFVRKREFDQLRKLRSRDPSAGNPDLAGRPSYFQSSLPANSDERAMTIKKIDEIEAQMSNQWWQGKNLGTKTAQEAVPSAVAMPTPVSAADVHKPAPSAAGIASYAATELAPMPADNAYAATKLAPMRADSGSANQPDFMPTQTNSSFGRDAAVTVAPTMAGSRVPVDSVPAPLAGTGAREGFAGSQSFDAESTDNLTDPDLEEAAIRFANGDNAGAETGLLNALQGDDLRPSLARTWTTALFDLYRATGQQARFDRVAIEYAERFGRSAPAWFSMPDMLGVKSATSMAGTVPSKLMDEPIWRSPADFNRESVDELSLAVANVNPPWYLDWREIKAIEPDAVDALGNLFTQWCGTSVQLRFAGSESLEKVLQSSTPPGDKSVSQAQWRLRMDALRIMQMQDEFELAALDYCVTYEVSPPSWQDARCSFYRERPVASEADSTMSAVGGLAYGVPVQNDAQTVPMAFEPASIAIVELSGEIQGEATEALAKLETALQGAERLVISCANLVRVDFSAAGSILNWVAMRQAEGCQLQFHDVHRLVATFFHVIGINEHARVVLRSN